MLFSFFRAGLSLNQKFITSNRRQFFLKAGEKNNTWFLLFFQSEKTMTLCWIQHSTLQKQEKNNN